MKAHAGDSSDLSSRSPSSDVEMRDIKVQLSPKSAAIDALRPEWRQINGRSSWSVDDFPHVQEYGWFNLD
ncbi:hypothetical protein PVAG01_05341 [Phlyctema vagabunda]|uniref:Uncharacterized protein n=1 Tax=Phlyctema vagabunda TaxID=108571 RepID=A0ABR4PJT4_9HELO